MRIAENKKIYTVSEVNYIAKQTLEQMPFWVEGEVSELKKNPNWSFYYLKMKDDYAILPCIASSYLLESYGESLQGQKVIVSGNLTLYEPNGQYQLRINNIKLVGDGEIALALEELIRKLKAEGLFDAKHKKEIPSYPKRVCLITSEGSDAENDFIRHSIGKFPIIELSTLDVRVQGQKAIQQLLKVLPEVDKMAFDVIVLTRGGGSLEDLAAFNDEAVARAIFNLNTPTIVAIGHESNESLAEWVADKRASTPTDAANITVESYAKILEKLTYVKNRLYQESEYYFSKNYQDLDHFYFRLGQIKNTFKDLPHKLNFLEGHLNQNRILLIGESGRKCDELFALISRNAQILSGRNKEKLNYFATSLQMLSPHNVLKRGYSITYDTKGNVISNIAAVEPNDEVAVKLYDGSFKAIVKSKNA